jgi:hypothetical protein
MARLADRRTHRNLILTSWALWPRLVLSPRIQARRIRKRAHDKPELAGGEALAFGKRTITAGNLRSDGWCFVEEVLSVSSHRSLQANWPSAHHFDALEWANIGKSYDTGFRWTYDPNMPRPDFGASSFVISSLHRLLADTQTQDWLRYLTGTSDDYIFCHTVASQSYSHSFLTPHKDSLGSNPHKLINLIYFVSAGGQGWAGGGTSILDDGTFTRPRFVPPALVNTALLYDVRDDFWHGFPRVPLGSWRRVVTAQFRA